MPGMFTRFSKMAGDYLLRQGEMRAGKIGSAAAWSASRAYGFATMGAAGQRAIAGATLGGLYGAFSNNTSVLGGALMGAGIGAGSVEAGIGVNAYRDLRSLGRGRGRAFKGALNLMAVDSRRFIGNSYTRAYNGFKGLRTSWTATAGM